MTAKKIFLIRHGETEYNRTGVVQGSGVNSSLNENGFKQAELFFTAYKDIPFEKIYTSSLKRTMQSVKNFLDLEIPHEILPGLNEISWGKVEGVPFNPENSKMYFGIIESWKKGNIDLKLDGGESPVEVKARQEVAIRNILDNTDEKLILISMHGRAMKILLAWISGNSVAAMDDFYYENLSLYVLKYDDNGFQIEINNDVSHLNGFIPII